MNRYLIIGLALAVAAISTGCPKPKPETQDTALTTGTEVTTPETTAPVDAASTEGAPADTQSADASSGDSFHTPQKGELTGTWFALLGNGKFGGSTFTYDSGHRIEFLPSGAAIWMLGDKSAESSWSLGGGQLAVIMGPGEDITSFGKITPLGFGRDDEVGLLSADAPGEKDKTMGFSFKPKVDGPVLALIGKQGELMVYGRADNGSAENAPDVSGNWKLTPAVGQSYDAAVKMQGNQMVAEWGPYHSRFVGDYTHGFFVGRISSSGGTALAAVAAAPGGQLDGVISMEPFEAVEPTFDFTRTN
jgi:hypothetical protein